MNVKKTKSPKKIVLKITMSMTESLSGTWYFFKLFPCHLHDFLGCFTPPTFFSLSFTLPRKDNTHAIDLIM